MEFDGRIKTLNCAPVIPDGAYVLYWMQHAQRATYNHALEYSISLANELNCPTVVLFVLTPCYPEATRRHYHFMLEGLAETQRRLEERGVLFVLRPGDIETVVGDMTPKASAVITDGGYTRLERQWRKNVGKNIHYKLTEIQTDVIVPVEKASDHEESAARTIRRKLHDKLAMFVNDFTYTHPGLSSLNLPFSGDVSPQLCEGPDKVINNLHIPESVSPVHCFKGGTSRAEKRLFYFLASCLADYPSQGTKPGNCGTSLLSPYLHFGQISPVEILQKVRASSEISNEAKEAFTEQLFIRRELAVNFVYYCPHYDQFRGLPHWAQDTLEEHRADPRSVNYSVEALENAATGDKYWNAAQREMLHAGWMHSYMRMYWGKKILEWCTDPTEAFRIALLLNNKYELDGRDPNGFAGIAWCFGKHDRGWKERPVFGKVRYMNAKGLERKFNMNHYLNYVESLAGR